ncbi:unnamed protein product [Cochlearia groenlandica]
MTKLERIFIYISLTLLLSVAVRSQNIDQQKWSVGNQFGYEGGFCLPGLCIRGSGGARGHYGTDYNDGGSRYYNGVRNGYRETMYCKPLACWGGSCGAIHLHLDKGIYESLVSKKAAKHALNTTRKQRFSDYNVSRTFKDNVNINNDIKEVAMAPQSN